MVKEEPDGYVVDRVLFEDMIKIGRWLIPVQATFASFFATILFFLVTILRPSQVYAVWAIAIFVDCVALAVFVLQAIVTYQRSRL